VILLAPTVPPFGAAPDDAAPAGAPLALARWTLHLPGGARREVTDPLPRWEELGQGDFSGVMRYETTFEWRADTASAILELGGVRNAAAVHVDGAPAGRLPWPPYRLRLGGLTRGRHTLAVDVWNTPASAIFGTPECYARWRAKGAFKGTYVPIYEPIDRARLQAGSGLLGPAALTPTR
jgi:hypothetical protein